MNKKTFYQNHGKRIFDLLLSFCILFFLWPLFVLIGLLIKIGSPGPILFRQKRAGCKGRAFTLYKFRTMKKNSQQLQKKYLKLNEADGPVFKILNDPRFINKTGRLLARSGLDELANIFNVLKGELSWVGPRPLPVNEAEKIPLTVKKIRESVLPGITSLWVINGSHSLNFKQWMALDQKYIKNITLVNDLHILSRTAILCLKLAKKWLVKNS